METTLPQTIATTTINPMSDQMRITASSLLLSLERPHLDINRKLRTPEDETKLSTMLHWISNVISSNTAAALSHDSSSGRLTLYLCSDSAHEASKNNATRLSDLMRKSLSGGNQSDQEDEYLAFVTDVCWERILNKVNHRVPRFPNVPRGADVSTMASVLETIIGLAEAWNAWRLRTGIPENSTQIMKMKQTLNHSQSFDTLKHCFEQVFRPLDDTEDHLQELCRLWRCCYALLKSDFFIDIFNSRWKRYSANETWFLCRVYRRIWRLYSYRRGADVLFHRGIPHLISIITQSGGTPDITVSVGFLTNLPVQSIWMCTPINSSSKLDRVAVGRTIRVISARILSTRRKPATCGQGTRLGQSMCILWCRWSTFYTLLEFG